MHDAVAFPLTSWTNFYVIIGSAAAALTGLMFVVITLIAGAQVPRSPDSVAAFGTPTIVHFCVALLVSALLSAPWQALWQVGLPLGLCGLGGVLYIVIVIWRARHQTTYQMVLEDWLWHVFIPLASYTALVVAAILLPANPIPALFCIAAVTILLLFIGIHNAWDAVTYAAIARYQPEDPGQD